MTQAFCGFLTKLPPELLHYHFGDTDPAGWSILKKLRQASPRPVLPFHMRWRPAPSAQPLNAHDRGLLPKLLASPLLADVHDEIRIMARLEDRGTFEQGLPITSAGRSMTERKVITRRTMGAVS